MKKIKFGQIFLILIFPLLLYFFYTSHIIAQTNAETQKKTFSAGNYPLPFKSPDTLQENLLGKVKSVKVSIYTPKLKFDKWVLGNPIDSTTRIFNKDGYIELFEMSIKKQTLVVEEEKENNKSKEKENYQIPILTGVGIFSVGKPCSFDKANRNEFLFNISYATNLAFGLKLVSCPSSLCFNFPEPTFVYREVFLYNISDNMVEQRILHKCEKCADFTLTGKIYIKFEKDKISQFDANGKIKEIATRKSASGKNYQYRYDSNGVETCRTVEDKTLKEYYTNGKYVGREKRKNYKIGTTEVTETWIFNEKKKIFELSNKTTRNETPSEIIEVSYPEMWMDGVKFEPTTTVFDKKTNLITQEGSKKYEYEFDSNGNWVTKIELKKVTKFGKTYYEQSSVIKREIIYY